MRIEIWNSFMFTYESWHPKSHLCCPNKLLDGKIQKWHISFEFVYPELCSLTYGYKYPEDKNLKLFRKKWKWVQMLNDMVKGELAPNNSNLGSKYQILFRNSDEPNWTIPT